MLHSFEQQQNTVEAKSRFVCRRAGNVFWDERNAHQQNVEKACSKLQKAPARLIHPKHITKRKGDTPMQIYDELVARGLIAQVTDEKEIRDLVNNGKATFYIGFDPTADSLHV